MNLYPIPIEFIEKKTNLTWCDIKWGYENNLITSEVLIKKAEKNVLSGSYNKAELELSFVIPNELNYMTPFFNELCPDFQEDEVLIIRKKWLYIILSWLWINRTKFEDPLTEIEIIYADFDYPPEIESFIKYMPPTDGYDPSMHSYSENINHLMNNWENYLKNNDVEFK